MGWSRFFRRKHWDEERARELDAYLEFETTENIDRGLPAAEARQAARRKLGNPALIREEIYRMDTLTFLESLWQDIRYSARALAHARAFSLVVIASLALGIGANTAVFSLVDAALLKMLPVKDPQQLVELSAANPAFGSAKEFSYAAFKNLRTRGRAFSGMLAFCKLVFRSDLEVNGQGGIVESQVVSGDYFSVLGIQPAIGRLIAPSDERGAGQSPVAVISYEYWQRRFALDPAVVGKKIVLNNSPYTIIGVTPPEFFGLQPGEKVDVSVPITMMGHMNPGFAQSGTRYDILTVPFNRWLRVMARLQPGVSRKEALASLEPGFREDMRSAAAALSGLPFDTPAGRQGFLASKLQLDSAEHGLAALREKFSKPLWILMAVVCLLLLVTCANVANLLLARANARRKEIAVRLAVGADRWRIARQVFAESALLAAGGGAFGLTLAFLSIPLLLKLMSQSDAPISLHVQPDATVLAFTLFVSLLAALLFGVLPAWRATRLDGNAALMETTRISGRGAGRSKLGKTLIVSQLALSTVLLVGAGLLARSLGNLKNLYPGFNKEKVLLFSVHPMTVGYDDTRAALLFDQLLDRVRQIPGVRSASFSFYSPLDVLGATEVTIEDLPSQQAVQREGVGLDVVGPDYFKTLQTPVLSGRGFTSADRAGSPKVAVINQAMAREYFGATSPIGRHPSAPGWSTGSFAIAGVVRNLKTRSLREQAAPMVYLPLYQAPEGLATFEVRTAVAPLAAAGSITRAIQAVDGRLPVYAVKTLDEQVNESLVQERLVASLSSLFGVLALLLAAVGLYGLMTYTTNRRTGEIGIRMALGARRGQIIAMVLDETLLMVAFGLAIGVPVALAASRLIRTQLFGLRADDPLTLGVSVFALGAVAVLAGYLPARRAARVDPVTALREE